MAATVLLLLLAGIPVMGSTPTEGSRFDWTLCKERLCFVNSGCSTISGTELLLIATDSSADSYKQYGLNNVPYAEGRSCKMILAIWPYTKTKWRITIETKFDAPNGVSLVVLDEHKNEKYKIVTCAKTNGGVAVSTKLSRYSTEIIGASHGTDHSNCEFFLRTSQTEIMDGILRYDKIALSYGTAPSDVLSIGAPMFFLLLDTDNCDPDHIKFDQTPAKPGQRLMPVNSDRFALTCPQDYDLMYDDGAKIHKVSMIKCVPIEKTSYGWRYRYQITPLYGVGDVVSIPYNQEFKAHCAPPCN